MNYAYNDSNYTEHWAMSLCLIYTVAAYCFFRYLCVLLELQFNIHTPRVPSKEAVGISKKKPMKKDKSKMTKKATLSKEETGGDPEVGYKIVKKLYETHSFSIPTGDRAWKKKGLFYLNKNDH